MKASSDGSGSLLRSASVSLLVVLGLSGCATSNRAEILEDSAQAGFERATVDAAGFELTVFKRIDSAAQLLVVYIEGDGRAWLSKRMPSADPTPQEPVALRLATADSAAAILYLARPCQYLTRPALADCAQRYWTSHRYSSEVIDAMNSAIDQIIAGSGLAGESLAVGLIGYSGGGSVASLIAARRHDVVWLVTVAANLDHATWTRMHNVSQLSGSLNATDVARQLATLPQVHLVGGRDRVVPKTVVQSFIDRQGENTRAKLTVVPGFDHHCCWHRRWPQIACQSLRPLLTDDNDWCRQ
jgi:uncharacterized protein YceK